MDELNRETVGQIKGAPLETADLPPAQAGGQLCVEEIVPELVLAYGRHQRIQLGIVQDALGLI